MPKPKGEIVFKVVRRVDGRYYSALGDHYPFKYDLEYKLNKFTDSADNTLGILVFKKLEYARKFHKTNVYNAGVIFKCKTTNLKRNRIKLVAFISFLDSYYCQKNKHLSCIDVNFTPRGTYACQSLIPIEVI